MKPWLLPLLACPVCKGSLFLGRTIYRDSEIESGELNCEICSAEFPIVDCVPRFVAPDNYASSFGFQWARFRQTQLDSYTGTSISRDRFIRSTSWDAERLAGAVVLDAGCGAGRFAEVALSLGARVVAIDSSQAVGACWKNLGRHPGLAVLQADIYRLPFRAGAFDFIYSLGVLQHTPDVRGALAALVAPLGEGGCLAVDIYERSWKNLFHPKYWLRGITTRLPRTTLFRLVQAMVPALLPASRIIGRIPAVGPMCRRLVPVADYTGVLPLSRTQLREWAVLDTFDWLSPAYDQPQTPGTLRAWLNEFGLEQVSVAKIAHLVGRARKPLAPVTPCE